VLDQAGPSVAGVRFLVVHDAKSAGAPRLSELLLDTVAGTYALRPCALDSQLEGAKDIEAIFAVPQPHASSHASSLFCVVQSDGQAYGIEVARTRDRPSARVRSTFRLRAPRGAAARFDLEGARLYTEDSGHLFLEYACRGGARDGPAWVARVGFDPARLCPVGGSEGPVRVEALQRIVRADVRQVADLGSRAYGDTLGARFARHGVTTVAAFDDEAHERGFFSVLYTRSRVSNGEVRPLYFVRGRKIEAITDIAPGLALYASDDESQGGRIGFLDLRDGTRAELRRVGARMAARARGVSGIAAFLPRNLNDGGGWKFAIRFLHAGHK
jgi:hypothetical protein